MEGSIDSSFTTEQRDLFASGMIAEIGVNAYAVWHAIKFYADFNTGESFPGMRTLGVKLGLSAMTVQRATERLIDAKMLRIVKPASKRKGQTYIAREKMAIRIGNTVICTIVVDYVPTNLRQKINRIEQALQTGEHDAEAWAEVEIIAGTGFVWDEVSKSLKGKLRASEIPNNRQSTNDEYHQLIGSKILEKIAPNVAKKIGKK